MNTFKSIGLSVDDELNAFKTAPANGHPTPGWVWSAGTGTGAGLPGEAVNDVRAQDAERRQVVLRPAGEIDMSTADALERELLDAVRSADVDEVLVDLAGIAFLDSSGVRVLVHAAVVARERAVTLRVARPQPVVARVLRITSVDALLGLTDGGAEDHSGLGLPAPD